MRLKWGNAMRKGLPLALGLLFLLLGGTTARAEEGVDLALVLVADVSRSIDDSEFRLQKEGYAAAFKDDRVLAAIHAGPHGAIAVSYIEFAGSNEVRQVLGWTIIKDGETGATFADKMEQAPRSFYGRTSISAGVDLAVQSFGELGMSTTRRVIDVSGDGTNNAGRDVTVARDEAVAAGIIINGLAIINDHPVSYSFAHVQPPGGLTNWYRNNVIGGPGSFVLEVHDFHSFGEAMIQKLVSEIAALVHSGTQG
jgi:hypothetical protein